MDAICYTHATLASFMLHILYHHEPGTLLIVCCERRVFIRHLLKFIERYQERVQRDANADHPMADHHEGVQGDASPTERLRTHPSTHPLLTRTLSILAASQTVDVAFCPSVQVLHAYLTTLLRPKVSSGERKRTASRELPTLALINPVSLHRETASYSAQGISETLAAAVESSVRSERRFVVVETIDQQVSVNDQGDVAMAGAESRGDGNAVNVEREQHDGANEDSYQQQVPIVNATTKMFGMSGERNVSSRTVKVEDVVRRWCHFQQLPGAQ